jgi:hypothetical protein
VWKNPQPGFNGSLCEVDSHAQLHRIADLAEYFNLELIVAECPNGIRQQW